MIREGQKDASPAGGLRHAILTLLALAYVLFASYPPLALAILICLFFLVYISVRLLWWAHNDRFTPERFRVGLTWALVGIDEEAAEYDSAPARTYFSLLLLLFAGLLIRPILGWLF